MKKSVKILLLCVATTAMAAGTVGVTYAAFERGQVVKVDEAELDIVSKYSVYIDVTFRLNAYDTENKGDIYICGTGGGTLQWAASGLNNKMTWGTGNTWTITLTLKVGDSIQYKYYSTKTGAVGYEGGVNKTFTVSTSTTYYATNWQ